MSSDIPPRAAEAAHAGGLIDAIKIVCSETGRISMLPRTPWKLS
ncbi:MAG: hypothetical protein ACRERR_09500 [Moraxellaceae bacterium]